MITVFTTSACAYCKMVKQYLTMKGREYKVVNLDDDPKTRQFLFEKTGVMAVPITQIDDDYIIGWNPVQLSKKLVQA
jgi:glutaredoxin